jgi:hypothetical protein
MAGGTTLNYSGGSVKYTSALLQGAFEVVHTVGENALGVTQAVGEGVQNVGKSLEEEFQSLNNFSKNCLREEQYQDLIYTNYDFEAQIKKFRNIFK